MFAVPHGVLLTPAPVRQLFATSRSYPVVRTSTARSFLENCSHIAERVLPHVGVIRVLPQSLGWAESHSSLQPDSIRAISCGNVMRLSVPNPSSCHTDGTEPCWVCLVMGSPKFLRITWRASKRLANHLCSLRLSSCSSPGGAPVLPPFMSRPSYVTGRCICPSLLSRTS